MPLNTYNSYKLVSLGISEFIHPHYHLPNARSDAEAFTQKLEDDFGFTCIAKLFDQDATRAAILHLFDTVLPKVTHENDALLIFVATHGHPCEDRMGNDDGFVVPHDGDKDDPSSNILVSRIRDSYLPYIRAKHVLWVADFCYSGLGMRDLTDAAAFSNPSEAVFHDLTRKPIRQMLSAGARDQRVLDGGRHGRSIFLDRIMEVMDDSGEYFTVEKAAVKIRELVAGDAKRLGHTQTPQFGVLHGNDATFVFHSRKFKTAAPIPSATTPAPHPLEEDFLPTDETPTPAPTPRPTAQPDNPSTHVLQTRDREIIRLKGEISTLLQLPDWAQSPAHCYGIIEHCQSLLPLAPDDPWIETQLATLWQCAPWCLLNAADTLDRLPGFSPKVSDVYSADFSPDATRLCLAGEDPNLQLFAVPTGHPLEPLITGHTAFVRSARYSPDGSMLLTASADATARVIVLENRQLLRIFPHPARALCAAWSPDSRAIVVGGDNGHLLLWGLTDYGKPRKLTGHDGKIFTVAFSVDGKIIASAGQDKTLRFWNADTAESLAKPFTHPATVYDLALTADGKHALTACADSHLRLLDGPTKVLKKFEAHTDIVWSIRLLRGERHALSASADGKIILWDLTTGRPQQTLNASQNWLRSVAITPNAQILAAAGHHQFAGVWQLHPRAPGITRHQLLANLRSRF